jgi:hypothetical protein
MDTQLATIFAKPIKDVSNFYGRAIRSDELPSAEYADASSAMRDFKVTRRFENNYSAALPEGIPSLEYSSQMADIPQETRGMRHTDYMGKDLFSYQFASPVDKSEPEINYGADPRYHVQNTKLFTTQIACLPASQQRDTSQYNLVPAYGTNPSTHWSIVPLPFGTIPTPNGSVYGATPSSK